MASQDLRLERDISRNLLEACICRLHGAVDREVLLASYGRAVALLTDLYNLRSVELGYSEHCTLSSPRV